MRNAPVSSAIVTRACRCDRRGCEPVRQVGGASISSHPSSRLPTGRVPILEPCILNRPIQDKYHAPGQGWAMPPGAWQTGRRPRRRMGQSYAETRAESDLPAGKRGRRSAPRGADESTIDRDEAFRVGSVRNARLNSLIDIVVCHDLTLQKFAKR